VISQRINLLATGYIGETSQYLTIGFHNYGKIIKKVIINKCAD